MTTAATWLRVSGDSQTDENQIPDVERFVAAHGLNVVRTYQISDTAWKDGGGPEYKRTLAAMLDDAWRGEFTTLVVWALDRIVRNGPEDALRLVRQLRERGVTLISIKESWLNGSPEVQALLISFAAWMAERESARRSERVRAGIARKQAADPTFRPGRQAGAKDKRPRKRSGYVAREEARREARERATH